MKRTVFVGVACFLAGCAGQSEQTGAAGTWVGTITTEGNVTTVVNESGSVWGGSARLVEEASIGVDVGEDPYMLASIASIAATKDRIYVLETRPPVLRVYDMAGAHRRDIGGSGQGPGEFQGPLMSLVVRPDGHLVVRDDSNARMSVFSPAGELVDTWAMPGGFRTVRESVATRDGTVYVPQVVDRDPETRLAEIGMVPYDAEGNPGEPLKEPEISHQPADFPPIVRPRPGGGRRSTIMPIPFMPRPVAVLSPVGAWVVGVGSAYRFEVRYLDGSVMVVERRIDPFPISAEEAEENRRRTIAKARSRDPGWTWEGPDVPAHKPFFDAFHADQSGRVWVRRRGPSIPIDDCGAPGGGAAEAISPVRRCFKDDSFFDVFGSDGRYLGEVPFPAFFRPFGGGFGNVFMRDDLVLMEVEDDAGTPMVKRYRLVLPEEEGG